MANPRAIAFSAATRTLRVARVASCVALSLLTLSGCGTQGTYTKERVSTAKVKMEGLKAATEHQMALQAFLAGDLPKAIRHCDYSISLNSKVVRSQLLRGRIMMEMGNVQAASEAFTKAQELGPEDAEVQYFQGLLAERVDDTAAAIFAFERASNLQPTNAQYAIAAAENMIDARDIARAESFLKARSGQFKHNPGIRHLRGHIELMKGNKEAAVQLFSEARLLAPDDATIIEDLSRTQIAVGEFGQAESNLQQLLRRPELTDRRDLRILRARCLVELGRVVDARTILIETTSSDAGANDIEAWSMLAKVSVEVRDFGRARAAANRVIALSPKQPQGYVLRALVQRGISDLPGAQASIEQAIAMKPDAASLTLFGMILNDRGNQAAASRAFAKAVEIQPNYEPAVRMQQSLATAANATNPTSNPITNIIGNPVITNAASGNGSSN